MLAWLMAAIMAAPVTAMGDKKKKVEAPAPAPEESVLKRLDYSKIVWPNPPAITRVKYLDFFSAEKYVPPAQQPKKKSSWMAKMAGGEPETKTDIKPRFQLWTPYGMAVDSKGRIYVADAKVGAIFIWDTETKDLDMIKHGLAARFGFIVGLAMDDNDRLFVSDSQLNRILVFTPQHKMEGTISEGLVDPGGLAIDTENRFLYVAVPTLDQIFVYDADKFNLIRRIGTTGKDHSLTTPGDFSRPTNVAVDDDGNLYVSDTYNNRVEIFDADGNFISAFGKNGDGPGRFARPKGIAVDADGHVWVADGVQDRLQCFTRDGRLLMWMGDHGLLPGQFRDLAGLVIDKNNRIFTSEQFPGRVQMFRYVTNDEARRELERREQEKKAKASEKAQPSAQPAAPAPSTVPPTGSTAGSKPEVQR
jgi:sugar lactone lactonase YvrE